VLVLLEAKVPVNYETPVRSFIQPTPRLYYTNMNYAFRVFLQSHQAGAQRCPDFWERLLQPRWKGEILSMISLESGVTDGLWGRKNPRLLYETGYSGFVDSRRPRHDHAMMITGSPSRLRPTRIIAKA
jgi:hypothetical protein